MNMNILWGVLKAYQTTCISLIWGSVLISHCPIKKPTMEYNIYVHSEKFEENKHENNQN